MANTQLIETSDILRVLSSGYVATLDDGTQGLYIVLALNPASGKSYPDGTVFFPKHIRLGDATYAIERLPERVAPWERDASLHPAVTVNASTMPLTYTLSGLAKETAQATLDDGSPTGGVSLTKLYAYESALANDAPAQELPETPPIAETEELPASKPAPIIVTMKDL